MKACIYTKYGSPDVLSIAEVQEPVITDDEVLIKVVASTVNRTDCGFRSAQYFVSRLFSGLLKPRNQILGNEFAGVIAKTGKNVTLFKEGDEVFGYNDQTFGAHAAYMKMAANSTLDIIPKGFTFKQAAALTEGAHYALCDIRAAGVKAGWKVLVNGATGAIGSAAVQLLKYFGAEVTAVCHAQHMEAVKALGADYVIDYSTTDFTLTTNKYNFVFDAVGKSSFALCKPLLVKNGIYISTELGKHGINLLLALTTPLFGNRKLLFPLPVIAKSDISFLKELAENGHFMPLIDKEYNLDEIVEAHRYVETGKKIGNVIINIS